MRLIAMKRVGHRKPGDVFNEPPAVANVLIKLGKAEKYVEPKMYETRAMKPAETKVEVPDETAELRIEYERVVGRRPFNGWDAETLREKIAEYNRRDMRAE